jgi:hypothetical protein
MTFSKVQKKGMGYERKNDDGEIKACLGAWFGHIQVQEKKERKKDSPYPKKGGERESHTKKRGLHTKIHKISTHLHILIRLHDLFLLGSSFWLRNIWKGSMPLHPYPELHRSLISGRWKRRHHFALVRISKHKKRFERTIWGAKLSLVSKEKKSKNPCF